VGGWGSLTTTPLPQLQLLHKQSRQLTLHMIHPASVTQPCCPTGLPLLLRRSLLMLLLPPILGLDPSKAAAAAPGQRLATLTDSHVGRLLRDDCYSHLLEVAVAVMPQTATLQGSAAPAEQGLAAGEEGLEGKKRKKRKVEGDDGAAAGEEEEEEQAAAAGKGLSLADEFYERFLRGRLLPLCCHHCANFVIQAVLSATHNKSRVSRSIGAAVGQVGVWWVGGECVCVFGGGGWPGAWHSTGGPPS